MKKFTLIFIIMISFFSKTQANYDQLAFDFKFNNIDGGTIDLKDYKGKVLVVVNVASRCGFTNQYDDLQKIWTKYKKNNFVIIGVPTNNFKQEPENNAKIKDFCETNFGIDFPMSEKVDVLGDSAHPFYKWAKLNYGRNAIPKWNFHKIIINRQGKVATTFGSITNPSSKKFINFIENQIKN